MIRPPVDSAGAARTRVADYVRRALPRELTRRDLNWDVEVEYSEREVDAVIVWGELRIRATMTQQQAISRCAGGR